MSDYFCLKCCKNHRYISKIGREHREHRLDIPEELMGPLSEACMKKQKEIGVVIGEYITEGVKKDMEG